MAADSTVVKAAYTTAMSMGASDKVMLALFEAGIVESGFRNLDHGDRDSVGFLQQRPSQGWGTREQCMDPVYATRKFVEKANRLGPDKYATAGQLAQAVQVSAFPLKYDAVRAQAAAMIVSARMSYPFVGGQPVDGGYGASDAVSSLQNLLKAAQTVTDARTWVRAGVFLGGLVLVIIAFFTLTGDGQMSSGSKKALGLATMVVTKGKGKGVKAA
jgi:hypothetical protein